MVLVKFLAEMQLQPDNACFKTVLGIQLFIPGTNNEK